MPKRSSSSVKVFYPRYRHPQLVEVLQEKLPQLATVLPLRRVVLFGSWATGRETAFSDIDLLVIYSGPRREEAYKLARESLNLRGLEPHIYSEEETEKMKPTLDRMTKDGIILFPRNQDGK